MSNKRWGGENANPITAHNPISTPELDEVLILLNPDCEDDEVREFYKQVINTYYLNLFMECLGEDDLVLKISSAHELYSGAIDADSYRRGFKTAQSMALNNLKNKLGVE